jgi:hypothetical protein
MKIAIKLLAFGMLFFVTIVSAQSYDLNINTPYYSAIPKNAVGVSLLEITVNAQKDDLFLSEIWIKANGMVSADDFERVWAETDDYQKSLRTGFFNDNRARLRFLTPVFIPANTSQNINILVSLDADTGGRSFNLALEEIVFKDSVNTNIVSQFYSRNIQKIKRIPSFRKRETQQFTNFDVSEVNFQSSGSESTIMMGRYAEIGKFRLFNDDKNSQLRTIRFRNYGDSDLEESFDSFSIQQNGREVASQIFVNGDYLTIQFEDYFLGKGDSVMLSVRARLIYAQRNDSVQLGIKNAEDFVADVVGTEFNALLTGFKNVRLKKHILKAGGIMSGTQSNYRNYRNSRNSTYSPTYRAADVYAPGSRDVLFLSQLFTQKNNFSVDGGFFPINSGSNISDKNNNGIDNEISDLELTFNSFQLFVDNMEIDSTNDFTFRNGRIGLEFDTNFDVLSQTHVQIFGRITNKAITGDKLKFDRSNIEFYSTEPMY